MNGRAVSITAEQNPHLCVVTINQPSDKFLQCTLGKNGGGAVKLADWHRSWVVVLLFKCEALWRATSTIKSPRRARRSCATWKLRLQRLGSYWLTTIQKCC